MQSVEVVVPQGINRTGKLNDAISRAFVQALLGHEVVFVGANADEVRKRFDEARAKLFVYGSEMGAMRKMPL